MREEGLPDWGCMDRSDQSTLLTMWTHYEGSTQRERPIARNMYSTRLNMYWVLCCRIATNNVNNVGGNTYKQKCTKRSRRADIRAQNIPLTNDDRTWKQK